jgi:hypothetical protein
MYFMPSGGKGCHALSGRMVKLQTGPFHGLAVVDFIDAPIVGLARNEAVGGRAARHAHGQLGDGLPADIEGRVVPRGRTDLLATGAEIDIVQLGAIARLP